MVYFIHMITERTYGGITWVDIVSPTKEEIERLAETYSIPALVKEEIFKKTVRSRADIYENLLYFILHFPVTTGPDDQTFGEELDFLLSKDFLITVHFNQIPVLSAIGDAVESDPETADAFPHAGHLFYRIVSGLYANALDELDILAETIEAIEENIFAGHEADMVFEISSASRSLIDFRQSIQFHKEALSSIKEEAPEIFGESFTHHLASLASRYEQIARALENHRETLRDLRETNDSLLTTKTNATMKKLTVLAFITFPLALIAGIFGMNTSYDPILGRTGDFWIIMGIMAAVLVAMVLIFRQKQWR